MSHDFLFHYLLLNMFRSLIHPSSVACDLFVEFHGLYCSGTMCVFVKLWFGWGGVVYRCRMKQCFNNSNNMSRAPEDGCINIRNMLSIKYEIINKRHQVGLSLFNYQDDARSDKRLFTDGYKITGKGAV